MLKIVEPLRTQHLCQLSYVHTKLFQLIDLLRIGASNLRRGLRTRIVIARYHVTPPAASALHSPTLSEDNRIHPTTNDRTRRCQF